MTDQTYMRWRHTIKSWATDLSSRVRRWLPRRPSAVGYRGSILLAFGVAWVVLGIGTIQTEPPTTRDGLLHELIPEEIRGWMWILTGLLAIAYAWRPLGKPDGLAFGALIIMPSNRVVSFAFGWVESWWPWVLVGEHPRGWLWATLYGVMVFAVARCAAWPEPLKSQSPEGGTR